MTPMFARHRLKKVTSVEDLRSLAEQRVPRACFQCRYGEMQEVLRVQRGIMLSDCLRQAMLRRTESRGTHARLDFPQTSDA